MSDFIHKSPNGDTFKRFKSYDEASDAIINYDGDKQDKLQDADDSYILDYFEKEKLMNSITINVIIYGNIKII